jgi:uncharacterized protein YifN (PemK superfamily)
MSLNLKIIFSCFLFFSFIAGAKELQTNATYSADVPKWVTKGRIDKVVDKVQTYLEWDIHRVNLYWYQDQASFEKVHSLGSVVVAVTKKNENSVHLGPAVTSENFDKIFAHELAHVIIAQKYKQAIPQWFEEGLANYISKAEVVDYKLLQSQPFPDDVHELTHPASGTAAQVHYKYMASQALAEMLAKKCDLKNLLRLSVGMKMDSYIDTYCEIKDLNKAFKDWVLKQGKK